MKKRKLRLKKATLRNLDDAAAEELAGGLGTGYLHQHLSGHLRQYLQDLSPAHLFGEHL